MPPYERVSGNKAHVQRLKIRSIPVRAGDLYRLAGGVDTATMRLMNGMTRRNLGAFFPSKRIVLLAGVTAVHGPYLSRQ